jgi:UDP-2-acetamido-3-amino-2,3-dideoxy-glucuronate N-acetyltransferase
MIGNPASSSTHPSCLVSEGARIAGNAAIGAFCIVGPDVTIGEGVQLEPLCQLLGNVKIAEDVRIGSGVIFATMPFANGEIRPAGTGPTRVEKGAAVHSGAVIQPGVTIGACAQVGPGAVVYHSVPSFAVVTGNPARIIGYVDAAPSLAEVLPAPEDSPSESITRTSVAGVSLHHLPLIQDMRGSLSVGEFERTVPFKAKRYFVVLGVPSIEIRGEHAHRECREFLVCVAGSCSVVADDGHTRQEFRLDKPNVGLLLPPMVWRVHYKYSEDAVLMVFASEHYDPADYIRVYDDFLSEVNAI